MSDYDLDQLKRLLKEADEHKGEFINTAEVLLLRFTRAALPALLRDAEVGQKARECREKYPITWAELRKVYRIVQDFDAAIDGAKGEGQ